MASKTTLRQEYGYLKRSFPFLRNVALHFSEYVNYYGKQKLTEVAVFNPFDNSITLNPKYIKPNVVSAYSLMILIHEVAHARQIAYKHKLDWPKGMSKSKRKFGHIEKDADDWCIPEFYERYYQRFSDHWLIKIIKEHVEMQVSGWGKYYK